MSCSNNLRQIGIALHGYCDVYGSFPAGSSVDMGSGYGTGMFANILPYLEQDYINEEYNPYQIVREDGQVSAMMIPHSC